MASNSVAGGGDKVKVHYKGTLSDGTQFDSNDGTIHVFRVISMDDETVQMDGNHPLAGKDLTFEITLTEICGKE